MIDLYRRRGLVAWMGMGLALVLWAVAGEALRTGWRQTLEAGAPAALGWAARSGAGPCGIV